MSQPAHIFQTQDRPDATPSSSWALRALPRAGKPPAPVPAKAFLPRGAKLYELDPHLHCSIIGTCLSTTALRKLVPKFCDLDRAKASDLDIHHMAVQLATEGGDGARALHKLLDTVYAPEIKRFRRYETEAEVEAAWAECLKHGDVPGAYWALMTHPAANPGLRQHAFGEVHMLSHLVGAANRADIRRLLALEEENATLRDKVDRQQQRLRELGTAQAAHALQERSKPVETCADERVEALESALKDSEIALRASEQASAHHAGRLEKAKARLKEAEDRASTLEAALIEAHRQINAQQQELEAVETHLADTFAPQAEAGTAPTPLKGKRIVYVGGRPQAANTIRALVEAAGGELLLHDGGIEDRRGLLPTTLAGADLVVFPVDCISHNSVTLLKRGCERFNIPYRPLRSSGVASFAALVAEIAGPENVRAQCEAASRICLHHG